MFCGLRLAEKCICYRVFFRDFHGPRPDRRVGPGDLQNLTGRVGLGRVESGLVNRL